MAIATEHDDDIDEHDDELTRETDDDSELVRRLRRQLKEANKRGKRVDDLEKEIRTLTGERVIEKAGLSELTERQRNTLLREVEGELTPEAIRDAAVELGWAQPQDDPVEQEITEQKAISDAAKGGSPKGGTQITPQEAAAWAPDRRKAFREQHPEAFKTLMQGQPVSGITF